MPEQLWFTAILNHYFARPVTALMNGIGLPPTYPQAPIANFVAMELLVFVILVTLFLWVRSQLSVTSPGIPQFLAESLEGFVNDQIKEVIGHELPSFVPFLATIFIFILLMNLIG